MLHGRRLRLDDDGHVGEGLEEGVFRGDRRAGDALEGAALVRTYDAFGARSMSARNVPRNLRGAGRAPVLPQSKASSCVPSAPNEPFKCIHMPETARPICTGRCREM